MLRTSVAAMVVGMAVAAGIAAAVPAWAQEPDTAGIPPGVRLGMIYETSYRPTVSVRPIEASSGQRAAAGLVGDILEQDLEFSDRFQIFADIPRSLASGPVDPNAWNDLGVVYLITGALEPSGRGYQLRIALHDVVYGRTQEVRAFALPARDSPGFRLAVHAVSDQIVEWITDEPGMAASRIVFVRRHTDDRRSLMIVDSDGENLEALYTTDEYLLSPAWSPDGRRIAFSHGSDEGHWTIRELDVETGEIRMLVDRPGTNTMPAYAPDGRRLAFSGTTGTGWALFEMDAARACCVERIAGSRRADTSPSFSADGRWVAFASDRLGQEHVYLQPRGGGTPELLSPFQHDRSGHFTAPDWSPIDAWITFHGGSPGAYQIMVANSNRPGATVRQLTQGGTNEDPSWAPDGRHIVFSGIRDEGRGLFVIDAVTGRIRPLALGGGYVVPDWSASLASRVSAAYIGGR